MRELTIGPNDCGQRLDKFLSKALPALPQSLLYKSIRTKRIKVNGKRTAPDYHLCEGETVTLYLNDEFFAQTDETPSYLSAGNCLDIVYEDENILLVNKPAGLVVHSDDRGSADTLIGRVCKYLIKTGAYVPDKENSFTPSLCHRIDRNTAGLVLCAKNAPSLRVLDEKIRSREIEKSYRCLVLGVPTPAYAVCKSFMRKDEKQKIMRVYDAPVPGGLTAITEYTVLERRQNGRLSLLEVNLHTGRTHQIRAQMAHLGHPLAGDLKYGTARQNQGLPYRYQALCAYQIGFHFTTEAGHLEYLSGKSFQLSEIPF